ncbi:alpha/beta fold hydrolase [Pelagerythrobacter marinus]|uniref:alpha/beta fold hydrolase n=1 Tax=Pelagerythrobacter marinus TaxID=538382 RepID=UPI0020366D54|nr:alpha/beta hydrolase [Pelagerythrobacter marinus]USA39392.1 alpha/beta fold hydrolase [Pelagerythrobacter marinus]WPZ06468.1 alpha/beta hydrolase [Pelagerythrobacter marinus]
MAQITANGIAIEYEDHGDPADPPILLIMGLGAQLTLWPIELVEALAGRGFRVIRYDNRDIGLSHKFDGVKAPGILPLMLLGRIGLAPRVPYTLNDMAADAVGLLDAIGIERAHIVGASMGGMIAQHVAFTWPERAISLTSIMSTTGNRRLPPARKEALDVLTRRPDSTDEAVLVAHGMKIARTIGSPAYPAEEERLRANVTAGIRRSYYPAGLQRQIAAIIADGDRRKRLRGVEAPTLVLHGEADPLVPLAGGEDTAAAIRGARLRTFPGMGHDLPLELVEPMAEEIAQHARAAGRTGGEA